VKFTLTGGAVTATNSYTAGGVTAPSAIALDSGGNAFVANFNGNSVTGLTSAGVALGGSPFTGSSNNITVPGAIAVSPTGTVYVTSGSGSIVNLSDAGAFLATLNDGTLQGPVGVAIDGSGRILATGFTTGTSIGGALSQFTSGGIAVAGSPATSGITSPAGVATDGTSIWVANNATNGTLAQFSYASTSPVSPIAGFGSLGSPAGVAVDASGSVWTANSGSNTVSKFIGLAVPVITPLAASVGP
jgi:sugar lactone lactonase YvrE